MDRTSGGPHSGRPYLLSYQQFCCRLGPLSRTEFTSWLASHLIEAACTAQHGPGTPKPQGPQKVTKQGGWHTQTPGRRHQGPSPCFTD